VGDWRSSWWIRIDYGKKQDIQGAVDRQQDSSLFISF
jgi:hypothetical protein